MSVPWGISQVVEVEENEMLILLLAAWQKRRKRKRRHRYWIHKITQKRETFGSYFHLIQELEKDEAEYFRLPRAQFDEVLQHVQPCLQKQHVTRAPICPKQQLAICIRFLATGESYKSLAFSYRLGVTTVSKFIPRVCEAIWSTMMEKYMTMLKAHESWQIIAENFEEKWNFPIWIGAIDGKHILMHAPANSGSMYFNYYVVLLALVDASYKFIYIDVGSYGRHSDGGIFSHSNLGKAINNNALSIPLDSPLPGAPDLGPMPYVIVANEPFPLHRHIMRPFPGKGGPMDQQAFKYRLSRARRIVENDFGILTVPWRVFFTRMVISPEKVNKVVTAACILHNMIQRETTPAAIASILQDYQAQDCEGMQNLQKLGTRATGEAIAIRNKFKDYFVHYNPLEWQMAVVTRGSFNV